MLLLHLVNGPLASVQTACTVYCQPVHSARHRAACRLLPARAQSALHRWRCRRAAHLIDGRLATSHSFGPSSRPPNWSSLVSRRTGAAQSPSSVGGPLVAPIGSLDAKHQRRTDEEAEKQVAEPIKNARPTGASSVRRPVGWLKLASSSLRLASRENTELGARPVWSGSLMGVPWAAAGPCSKVVQNLHLYGLFIFFTFLFSH